MAGAATKGKPAIGRAEVEVRIRGLNQVRKAFGSYDERSMTLEAWSIN